MFDKEKIANSAPEAQEIIIKGLIAVAAPDRMEEIESRYSNGSRVERPS